MRPSTRATPAAPLVDINGRVVGITTANATVSGDTGSIGVGFAIAGDQARSVAQELIDQS
jgi:putative serine protease PepD